MAGVRPPNSGKNHQQGASGTSKKKELTTCYGDIHIANSHAFSQRPNDFAASPLVQYKCLLVSELLPYQKAVELADTLARIQTNNNFLHRLVGYYGQQLADTMAQSCPLLSLPCQKSDEGQQPANPLTDAPAPGVVYALADGSMLLTEADYKEAKVGRIFPQSACQPSGVEGRNGQLSESVYCARLGDAQGFKPLFSQSLAQYAARGYELVFISDGAPWLRQMVERAFPKARLILDFYHAMEWLGKVAQGCIRQEKRRKQWLEEQGNRLLSSEIDAILSALSGLRGSAKLVASTRQYIETNRDRMDYASYQAQGWLIGSGAIESTHKTLLQSRLKLSGQRWSEVGANRLIALRVYVANGWHEAIRELIEGCPASYAMAA